MGIFDRGSYDTGEVPLANGDLLVVFSDGVTEAESPDEEEFGDERLAAAVLGASAGSATEVVTAVQEALRSFCGAAPLPRRCDLAGGESANGWDDAGTREARPRRSGLLDDRAAADAIARGSGRIGLHVVRPRVNHQRGAAVGKHRICAGAERDARIGDGRTGRPVRADGEVVHVAGVRPLGILHAHASCCPG